MMLAHAVGTVVRFVHRGGGGYGTVEPDESGWPVVRLASGATRALNPALNEITPADPQAVELFEQLRDLLALGQEQKP